VYDNTDNILQLTNKAGRYNNLLGVEMDNRYTYDNLGRLLTGEGGWTDRSKKDSNAYYQLTMDYSDLYNVNSKTLLLQSGKSKAEPTVLNKKTIQQYEYKDKNRPHQVTSITTSSNLRIRNGKDTTLNQPAITQYEYDVRGNNTVSQKGNLHDRKLYEAVNNRGIIWDEENRIRSVNVNGHVSSHIYDAEGERVVKLSIENNNLYVNTGDAGSKALPSSFTVYVNPYFSMRNGEGLYTKHIYIGTERIVSKLVDDNVFRNTKGSKPIFSYDTVKTPEGHSYKMKMKAHIGSILSYYHSFHLKKPRLSDTAFRHYKNIQQPAVINPLVIDNGSIKENINNAANESLQYWYHSNHLGSTNYVTDVNGKVVQYIEYLPFGEVFMEQRTDYSSQFTFNGKELDQETGLMYYGARYYDPQTYQWLGVDPKADKYPGLSGYNYCLNNPIVYSDPNGQWASKSGFYVHQGANAVGLAYSYISNFKTNSFTDLSVKNKALDDATDWADADIHQTAAKSYMHGMSDGRIYQSNPELAKLVAKSDADKYVRDQFAAAIKKKEEGNMYEAYFEFGKGLHALQDATSPSHEGFQPWSGEEGGMEKFLHGSQELFYPGIGSKLQKVTNKYLDWFENPNRPPLSKQNLFDLLEQ
jgi:RHS repeat-associated protein